MVFQRWSRDFVVSDDQKLKVPVWVELPGIPIPCWSFLPAIVQTVSKVVCLELDKFFNTPPQRSVCVEVNLSRNLKDTMEIQIAGTTFTRKVLYLNLLNICYRCQSAEHKIRDCHVLDRNRPSASKAKPATATKKDEWTTMVKKGKGSTTAKASSFLADHGKSS